MNTKKTRQLVALVSAFAAAAGSVAHANSLLGERYLGVNTGYERVSGFGESVDGWGPAANSISHWPKNPAISAWI